MSSFDLAVGLDATAMAQISAAVYAKVYPQVFTGSMQASVAGQSLTISWNVTQAPTFVLSAPPGGPQIVADHLSGHTESLQAQYDALAGDQSPITVDEVRQALVDQLEGSTFQMVFPGFDLTIDGTPPTTQPLQVTAYIQASSAGGVLSLVPLKAVATASNPSDQALVNQYIVPQALSMAQSLLQGLTLPPLSAGPVNLTAPNIFVLSDRVVAVAAIAGGSPPGPPEGVSWPGGSFFAVLSDRLRLSLGNAAAALAVGKGFSDSGSVGTSIGGASYGASGQINSASAALTADPTQMQIAASVSGGCHADVTLACIPIGVNYDLSTSPDPINATIQLSVQGQSIGGTIANIGGFTVILTPSGNPLEKVLSAITWPITQAVVAACSPVINNAITGMTFSMPLPSFPYAIGGATLDFQPTGLSIGNASGMFAVSGALAVS